MAPRMVLVAHAETAATRRGAFPADECIEPRFAITTVALRVATAVCGPELRCRQTAEALGWPAGVDAGFADLDAGRWAGADLADLMSSEPGALMSWMTDPGASGPGGESLSDLVHRVGRSIQGRSWPDGRSVVVAAPLVIRAALVHLLGATPSMVFGFDVEPLSAALVTGHGGRWKLRALLPWECWNVADSARSPL